MKLSGYYVYNNVAITALAIMSMLSISSRIPLSKVALLMPMLLDDNITQKWYIRTITVLILLLPKTRFI